MTERLRLVQVDFDNLENRLGNALTEKTIEVFTAQGILSAHGVAEEWIRTYYPQRRMYLGWDGQVYPQWRLKDDVFL